MQIKQFEDKELSHFSYVILSECAKEIVVIDPSRNIQQYIDYANDNGSKITVIIETHPHADFVSSHLELHKKMDATIYASKLVNAAYPHKTFDEGETINLGKIKFSALNTPGHSADSISIVLHHDGKDKAVFTGDTLFIGDCGRPDLRENVGNIKSKKEDLAKDMYYSLRNKLMKLDDSVEVYPAHGAGTLCGKNLSKESSSIIGKEKETNWSLQESTEEEFVSHLLADQPFTPAYFPFDVELNKKGAPDMEATISDVKRGGQNVIFDKKTWIVDVRKEDDFKKGHLPHSVNIQEDGKFETWLGSIMQPNEHYYLAAESDEQIEKILLRVAKIGYEQSIVETVVVNGGSEKDEEIDVEQFKENTSEYTIVDVRNNSEVKEGKIFENSLSIPLGELRNRISEIPTDKPILVHCAGGYRSAAGSSLIEASMVNAVKVFDLSDAVKDFQ